MSSKYSTKFNKHQNTEHNKRRNYHRSNNYYKNKSYNSGKYRYKAKCKDPETDKVIGTVYLKKPKHNNHTVSGSPDTDGIWIIVRIVVIVLSSLGVLAILYNAGVVDHAIWIIPAGLLMAVLPWSEKRAISKLLVYPALILWALIACSGDDTGAFTVLIVGIIGPIVIGTFGVQ